MSRKVSGKNEKSECVHIKTSNGNMYYSTKGDFQCIRWKLSKTSSSSNYSQQFQNIKVEKERENLNFNHRTTKNIIFPLNCQN